MIGFSISMSVVVALLVAAAGMALYRLLKGPSLADRVVALDVMASFAIGAVAVESIALADSTFIDAALVLALLAFLGTVAFARYLQKQVFK